MNNLLFNTHTSLTHKHAELSLWALSQQPLLWDNFVIYNSHEDELSNDYIEEIINKVKLKDKIKNIHKVFYDNKSPKSLGFDLYQQFNYALANFNIDDKYLLLKSDYCVSKNFYKSFDLLKSKKKYFFTIPTVNAKEFVSNEEIKNYLNRDTFIPYDEITYYHGSDMCSNDKPHDTLNGKTDLDKECKFVSCHILKDYNCHVLDGNTMQYAFFSHGELQTTWGGFGSSIYSFLNNGCEFICNTDSFAVHVYHDIISKNRKEPRHDPRKNLIGNRY
jgi:hypothetical protein